ncbi:MAG TPA: response regulator FixJ [Rhizomicrobium sp.]|nr:response regulator FixJ [Rhizomicrobium sp.]
MSASHTIHLIDDDEDVRKALAFLLGTAGHAVRVYESATAFLDKLDGLQPGCIVSDVRMPGVDGLEMQRRLKEKGIGLPIVVMTGHADVPLAVQAMKLGAVDFIEKPFADNVMLEAIDRALAAAPPTDGRGELAVIRTRLDALSERERQVLSGLLAGHPNKTIAYDLGISPRTVEVHRANVMTKMAAGSLSELVRMALLAGYS